MRARDAHAEHAADLSRDHAEADVAQHLERNGKREPLKVRALQHGADALAIFAEKLRQHDHHARRDEHQINNAAQQLAASARGFFKG
ncbi:MAG: hypothetical protein LC737_11100 [Chloroflexi bacterium]|nr:hypothetical protein [Chloroflexota bacterium]